MESSLRAMTSKQPTDTTTGEDIASTSIPPSSSNPQAQRNAFTELMSPKKPSSIKKAAPSNTPETDPATKTVFLGRDGLGAYITDPASFPSSRVIYHNEKWVAIHDLFPKSSIHLLLLPRDSSKQLLHPFDAFDDAAFLAEVQAEVCKLKSLAAKELKRRFGKYSKKEQARDAAMESNSAALPEGRDWERDIISGIHTCPSMSHLHIHVLSVDRYSECMRHRKHYNSFATPFLIDVEDFPLEKDDPRRHPGREGYLERDLICWRCGKGFGRSFAKLKEHLEREFESWRAG
ncbi:MAG: hypothetical protein Q9217_004792 [Psora testacea]